MCKGVKKIMKYLGESKTVKNSYNTYNNKSCVPGSHNGVYIMFLENFTSRFSNFNKIVYKYLGKTKDTSKHFYNTSM